MYNVAFRAGENALAYKGVMTWSCYPSKEDFDKVRHEPYHGEVVEEGITEERAIEITKDTPVECYLNAAVAEATDQKTGVVNLNRLRMRIEIAMFAINNSSGHTALSYLPPSEIISKWNENTLVEDILHGAVAIAVGPSTGKVDFVLFLLTFKMAVIFIPFTNMKSNLRIPRSRNEA